MAFDESDGTWIDWRKDEQVWEEGKFRLIDLPNEDTYIHTFILIQGILHAGETSLGRGYSANF